MRGTTLYRPAGILMVLAAGFAASLALGVGVGLAVGARTTAEPGATTQYVDRAHKGDRLHLPDAVGAQPVSPPMIGCDPPFSRLLPLAQGYPPGRCLTEIAHSVAA